MVATQSSPIATLTSPFPAEQLHEAYKWHKYTSSLLSGRWCSEREFTRYMEEKLSEGISWAAWFCEACVGIGVFSPIYRGGELNDGEFHTAFSRGVWGLGIPQSVAKQVFGELFESIPTLRRVSVQIPSTYTPSLHLAERVGMKCEGRLRSALATSDVLIYGVTRGDFYEFWRTNHNHHPESKSIGLNS